MSAAGEVDLSQASLDLFQRFFRFSFGGFGFLTNDDDPEIGLGVSSVLSEPGRCPTSLGWLGRIGGLSVADQPDLRCSAG